MFAGLQNCLSQRPLRCARAEGHNVKNINRPILCWQECRSGHCNKYPPGRGGIRKWPVMSAPTTTSLLHLRKLIGFMKWVGDVGVRMDTPQPGAGKFHSSGNCAWIPESMSDADWSSNKAHRRSTPCGIHMVNGCFVFGSSRSQRVISLSSCESELHSLVSCTCDGVFIRACLEFALGCEIQHVVFTDSSSARQLACRQGNGKVRHLSGKVLWIQQKTQDGSIELRQIPTLENLADIGTKVLNRQRLFYLMHEIGLVYIPTFENVGQKEHSQHTSKLGTKTQLKKIARVLLNMSLAMGLEPTGVTAQKCSSVEIPQSDSVWDLKWFVFSVAGFMVFMLCGWFAVKRVLRWLAMVKGKFQQLQYELQSAQEQLADHCSYAADLSAKLDECVERFFCGRRQLAFAWSPHFEACLRTSGESNRHR